MRLARLRHLTIESDGLLVGILSYRDLQDALLAHCDEGARLAGAPAPGSAEAVEQLSGSAYSIAPDATLAEAAARLEHLHVGCLPVVERSEQGLRVVGLLTEMDLLRAAYGAP
jgi:CBS domain-containing protein